MKACGGVSTFPRMFHSNDLCASTDFSRKAESNVCIFCVPTEWIKTNLALFAKIFYGSEYVSDIPEAHVEVTTSISKQRKGNVAA